MSAGMIMELRPRNYYPSLSPFPRWVIRQHLTQSTPPRVTSTRAGVWTKGQTSMQSVGSAGESFKFSHHAVDTRPHSELTGSVCPIPPKKGSKRQQNPDSQKASASGAYCATSNNCLHAFTMGARIMFLETCSWTEGGTPDQSSLGRLTGTLSKYLISDSCLWSPWVCPGTVAWCPRSALNLYC